MPQQQRDQNREITGTDTLLGACPAGAQRIAAGKAQSAFFFSRELTARAALRRHAAHNDIRSQYAYANNMLVQLLYESSSTPPCPSPRRKTGGASPSLRGEETTGRASDPRERALDLMGKEEDRDSPVFIPAT